MAKIKLEKVEKFFNQTQVLKNINLEINDGSFFVFVGPSGCGKSTLLRIIAGLEDVSSGSIFIDNQEVTSYPAYVRKLSMVFQSYALYPHMNVKKNLSFALKTAKLPTLEINARVNKAANILKLDNLLTRYPKELSGGQRQRVAIGRSIVRNPRGFLFDEPLSNLDAALRGEMRYEIASLHQALKTTMIYVTHDQIEAMTLADKIVILQAGEIVQIGTPKEVYEKPENLFVAEFIGSPKMNIFPWDDKVIDFPKNSIVLKKIKKYLQEGKDLLLGIRPEHLKIATAKTKHLQGTIKVIEYLGSESFIYLDVSSLGTFILKVKELENLKVSQKINITFDEKELYFFDKQSTKSITL